MNKFLPMILIGILCILTSMLTTISSSSTSPNHQSYFGDLETSPQNASTIVMGASYIRVPENAKVVTQVDRVIKDMYSKVNVETPPGQSPNSSKQLVPYMEGARVGELMNYAHVEVVPVTGVSVKKIGGEWYGPDENGNFVFGVDPSKIGPLFAVDGEDNNTKLEINTHGMNVLVPCAIKNNAYLVVGCGDLPGKANAEKYMAERGINCYAPCDRFTSSVMPYNGTGVILGGEPIRSSGSDAIIGAQPVSIDKDEIIIVQTTNKTYPDQYCDTPNRYFKELEKAYDIRLNRDVVDAGIGETCKIVDEAQRTGANVIAVRVLKSEDKIPVAAWLKSDKNHRAILFHSAAYGPGYSLFFEFPEQVTGQDLRPLFLIQTSKPALNVIFDQIRGLWS
jgi:hypothetical protein